MWEVILKLIEQLNSSVFVLLLILIIAFLVCYKAGGIVNSFKSFKEDNKSVKDRIEDVKETLLSKIDSVKDKLSDIKSTTDLLYNAHLQTVKKESPVSLTELGKEIAKEISAEEKVNNYWSEIKNKIESHTPTNPYDVQQIAMEIAKECFKKIFSLGEQSKIKTISYEKGLNILQIYPIIGIFIRDRYLQEKNMGVDEIDKFDPAVKKTV
ncbi:hypothetical protein COT99_03505 [Candidatus Falkowbacteria bacterium CG10_big_fil_rev_8_21_14_0_10_43_10]|uniref:Uncharacterized protein n=1 Tax=Candidatus Falkowbacteria bacterium CG10_big_fil_rev_8_21_14_0_10_43_10 TaxID=1974567 RepID=A0A2H0V1I5_9BACT|nr:MAG: hypothetical protein COT99_03505 [Candidatus Falkowbacteria bacterium CG10_big_fil_rev_8_21_14_0_10_43_10]